MKYPEHMQQQATNRHLVQSGGIYELVPKSLFYWATRYSDQKIDRIRKCIVEFAKEQGNGAPYHSDALFAYMQESANIPTRGWKGQITRAVITLEARCGIAYSQNITGDREGVQKVGLIKPQWYIGTFVDA
jgi:hypothetical protein